MKSSNNKSILNELPKENIFEVPAHYFENLNQLIISEITLDTINTKKLPFETPVDYFNKLNTQIESEINLNNYKSDNVYNIPNEYFDDLSTKIENQIFTNELNQSHPFQTPENYFKTLENSILESNTKKKYKEISLQNYFLKYAVAASLLLTTCICFWKLSQTNQPNYVNSQKNIQVDLLIASLNKSEIESYLTQNETFDELELLSNTSNQKKDVIIKELENSILPKKLNSTEKSLIESEIEHINLSDLDTDI